MTTVRSESPEISSELPLKPATFMVLLVLNSGAKHGYGIKKEVRQRSDDTIRLDPGGLYRLIARLEKKKMVRRASPPSDATNEDERRNYYELTTFGRQLIGAEARRMATLVGLSEVVTLADTTI